MASVDEENSSASNDLTATTSNSNSSSSMSTHQTQNPLLKASMLRPSAFSLSAATSFGSGSLLGTNSAGGGSGLLGGDTGGSKNPFAKASNGAEETEKEDASMSTSGNSVSSPPKAPGDPLSLLARNGGLPKSNLFCVARATPISSDSGFVFGQNVQDRVTGNAVEAGTSNGDLLFSTVVAKDTDKDSEEEAKETGTGKSLSEVAREYEESRARKRKFEEVETFTGEEDETNVLDINCKLFTFVASLYEERGRGSLRLNDPKIGSDSSNSSRVVFRTSGSLRVLLNTKIWDGMIAERPSGKSLRLTAIDNSGLIKVYLVMARPNDINCLQSALQKRIQQEIDKSKSTSKSTGEETLEKNLMTVDDPEKEKKLEEDDESSRNGKNEDEDEEEEKSEAEKSNSSETMSTEPEQKKDPDDDEAKEEDVPSKKLAVDVASA